MFDEPHENHAETASDPDRRVKEKSDELRMYAELAAVFEGTRKFDAELRAGLDPDMARDVQRTMAKLAKAKIPDTPVISPDSIEAALNLLKIPATGVISTNDYHIYRRPGEVMVVRWLEDEQVDAYYKRFQAHFDAGLEGVREDERQASEWKADPATLKYLEKLDEYLAHDVRRPVATGIHDVDGIGIESGTTRWSTMSRIAREAARGQGRHLLVLCGIGPRQAAKEADDGFDLVVGQLVAELDLPHDADGLRQVGHRSVVEVRSRRRGVPEAWDLEFEPVGGIVGDFGTALVVDRRAGGGPVIRHDAELAEALAADAHKAAATKHTAAAAP